jgi:hypothetical protein
LKCCGGSFAKYNEGHAPLIIYNARAYHVGRSKRLPPTWQQHRILPDRTPLLKALTR